MPRIASLNYFSNFLYTKSSISSLSLTALGSFSILAAKPSRFICELLRTMGSDAYFFDSAITLLPISLWASTLIYSGSRSLSFSVKSRYAERIILRMRLSVYRFVLTAWHSPSNVCAVFAAFLILFSSPSDTSGTYFKTAAGFLIISAIIARSMPFTE